MLITNKKIVILGGNGLLGTALSQFSWPRGYELISFSHKDLDITDSKSLEMRLSLLKPDCVINASVYGKGEGGDAEKSYLVNALSLYSLATYCKKNNILLIHYPTDYVFDGYQRIPYKEDDRKNPLNVYGNSKYAGELIIEKVGPPYFIIRSSWLFGTEGKNFVTWVYEKSKTTQILNIVDDQVGCPTYVMDVVQATVSLLENYNNKNNNKTVKNKTYNLTGKEPISWYLYAKQIGDEINIYQDSQLEIIPISTADYKKKFPTLIERPLYSVLDCNLIAQEYSIHQKSWKDPLKKVVRSLIMDKILLP